MDTTYFENTRKAANAVSSVMQDFYRMEEKRNFINTKMGNMVKVCKRSTQWHKILLPT